jgi:hypothetical protein
VFFHNGRNISDGNFLVKSIVGLDGEDRPLSAKTIASSKDDVDLVRKPFGLKFSIEGIPDPYATPGNTSGPASEHNARAIVLSTALQSFPAQ